MGGTCYLLVLILVASFVSFTGAQVSFPTTKDGCTLGTGERGTCLPISSCPSALRTFRTAKPVSCGFRGRTPIICCPSEPELPTDMRRSTVVDVSPPKVDFLCGIRPKTESDALAFVRREKRRIAGGFLSERNTWPWMALLGEQITNSTVDWMCAGSLINDRWILTAAHCFDHRTPNVVRLGEHDYADPDDGAEHEDFSVEEKVSFPNYTFPQAYHDLALVRLDRKVTLQSFINPVCLPWGEEGSSDLIGRTLTLTGWGAISHGGEGSTALMEVEVTTFASSRCDDAYKSLANYNRVWPAGIREDTLCAGDEEGGKDACQGDSGGPAVYANAEWRYILAGVISRGYGCGHEDFPGLYTNALRSEYLAWIKNTAF